MPEIRVLPQEVADKIAAGEVAERPSAVVKELVENSLDAGASSVEVEIRKGGVEYIRVCDNGCGMTPEQVETAFLRHATSKLKSIDDLYSISTMGFRGEALSSICAVAGVEVITKTADGDEGVLLRLNHGEVCEKEPIACADGTTMIVEKLFENIPARMKFLKKDSTEAGYVADVLGRIALSRPDVAFSYICDGKEIFSTSGDGKLKNAILRLYGIEYAKAVIDVDYEEDNVRICGQIGKPEIARGNRTRQTMFVNGRYIKSHVISKIVQEAYRNSVMVGRFPFFVLDIIVAPECVDVNVHPAKTEIKFSNESRIYDIVFHAVKNALRGGTPIIERMEQAEEAKQTDANVQPKNVYTKSKMGGGYADASRADYKFGRIEPKLVKEYLDNVIPSNETEKNAGGDILYGEDFLNGVKSENNPQRVLEFRETDVPIQQKSDEIICIDEAIRDLERSEPPVPIGQVFETYILCQAGETLYMIDQHAAHERLRFESLKKSYFANERMSQILLSPMIIKLDFAETRTVLSNIEAYNRFGFEIEDFGSGSVIVNATPIAADEAEIRDLILEIADALSEAGRHPVTDFEERALDMIACKYAIKANHRLNAAEMQDLINKVWDMERQGIRSCPHGRPIRIEFSKTEIEKMFKRRV